MRWLERLLHSKNDLRSGLMTDWGLSVQSFHAISVQVCVSTGCSGFLPQSKQPQTTNNNKPANLLNVLQPELQCDKMDQKCSMDTCSYFIKLKINLV